MHRFFLSSLDTVCKQYIVADVEEVHHMSRVLRLKPGDELELINGRGLLAQAQINSVAKHQVAVEVLNCVYQEPAAGKKMILACALPKRSQFDDILEKCTELGVDEVVPLITERTEAVPSREAMQRMNERFSHIVVSASKQCRRLWFPVIHPVMRFEAAVDLLADSNNTLFIPWLEGKRVLLKDALTGNLAVSQGGIVFFIGPEGDFSTAEAEKLIGKGAVPVTLGATVLRVATAAIAVTAFTRLMKDYVQ